VIWSGTVVSQPTTFQAVFDLAPPAVAEPASSVLGGIAVLTGLVTWAGRRRTALDSVVQWRTSSCRYNPTTS
jgi:hypothetical protein